MKTDTLPQAAYLRSSRREEALKSPPGLHLLKRELQHNYLLWELRLARWMNRHLQPAIRITFTLFCLAIILLIALQIHRQFPGN